MQQQNRSRQEQAPSSNNSVQAYQLVVDSDNARNARYYPLIISKLKQATPELRDSLNQRVTTLTNSISSSQEVILMQDSKQQNQGDHGGKTNFDWSAQKHDLNQEVLKLGHTLNNPASKRMRNLSNHDSFRPAASAECINLAANRTSQQFTLNEGAKNGHMTIDRFQKIGEKNRSRQGVYGFEQSDNSSSNWLALQQKHSLRNGSQGTARSNQSQSMAQLRTFRRKPAGSGRNNSQAGLQVQSNNKGIDVPLMKANLAYSVLQFKNQLRSRSEMSTHRSSHEVSTSQVSPDASARPINFSTRWNMKSNEPYKSRAEPAKEMIKRKEESSNQQEPSARVPSAEAIKQHNGFGRLFQQKAPEHSERRKQPQKLIRQNSTSIERVVTENQQIAQKATQRSSYRGTTNATQIAYNLQHLHHEVVTGYETPAYDDTLRSADDQAHLAFSKRTQQSQKRVSEENLKQNPVNGIPQRMRRQGARSVDKIQQLFKQMQSQDQFEKEPVVHFNRKVEHQNIDGPRAIKQISSNEFVLNPKVTMQTEYAQPKKELRDSKLNSYLGKRYLAQQERELEFARSINLRWDKEQRQLLGDNKLNVVHEKVEVDIGLDQILANADEFVKKKREFFRRQKIFQRIKTSMNQIKRRNVAYVEEIDRQRKDIVGINSESDASQFHFEDREIQLENDIIERMNAHFLEEALVEKPTMIKKFSRKDGFGEDKRCKVIANEFIDHQQAQNQKFSELVSKAQIQSQETERLDQTAIQDFSSKIVDKRRGTIDADTFVTSMLDLVGAIPTFTADKPQIQLQTLNKVIRNRQQEALSMVKKDSKRSKNLIDLVKRLIRSLKFTEIGRHMSTEGFRKLFAGDPMLVYHKEIHDTREIALPLINKVIDGKLVLQGYTLDSGHFEALAAAIKETKRPLLQDIYLENCGVDDHELALLLEGIFQMGGVKKLIYKNNVFLEESLDAIKPVLEKRSPHNLLELRLANLTTNPQVIDELLEFMIMARVELRTLGLVQLHMSQLAIEQVARYVDESVCLEDLDISWNDLIPQHFTPLLQVISKNRMLKSLNMSWNTIIDQQDKNNPVSFKVRSALEEYVEQRKQAIEQGDAEITTEQHMADDHPKRVIYSLNQFIRYNKRLQSLNLSNTGLNGQVIVGIIQSLRHAKGLLCLHLTSNPGLSDQVEQFYRERLSVMPHVEPLHIEIENENIEETSHEDIAKMTKVEKEILQHKIKISRDLKLEQVCRYLNNKRLRPVLNRQDVNLRAEGRDLTITRKLGHKQDIPSVGQWKMFTTQEQDVCWACDRWMYTLVFWNKDIGEFNNINSIGVTPATQKSVVQQIRLINGDGIRSHPSVPVLFSDISEWKPRPFTPILDFLNNLEYEEYPIKQYEAQAIKEAKVQLKFKTFSELGDQKLQRVHTFIASRLEESRKEYMRQRILQTPGIIQRHCRYKNPRFINMDKLTRNNFEEMWVLPLFLQPGKIDWMVRSPEDPTVSEQIQSTGRDSVRSEYYQRKEDCEFFFYYNRFVIEIREEGIPFYAKKLRTNQTALSFIRSASVFRDWQEDTSKVLAKAWAHDIPYVKLGRIIDDISEHAKIKEVLHKYYSALKGIFVSVAVEGGTPPDMGKREVFKFTQDSGIADSNIHAGIVDTLFKACNFEETEQEGNDDNALCRFEFLEMVVRLAKAKFMDFGSMTSLSEAVERLIKQFILPVEKKYVPWQKFRDEQMYTNEVNDLLQVNLNDIRKLFDLLAKVPIPDPPKKNLVPVFSTKIPTIDQILVGLSGRLKDIDDRKLIQAFYLSKSTIPDETDAGPHEYTFLQLPEFIEFIPRLAWLKYRGQPEHEVLTLKSKIKSLLDLLLPFVSAQTILPPELAQVISDSDDEY